ncbi:ABC transporter substrate-binding protein [Cumulibacter soli]|uniref:ABC transporter substrate-binding protein n=1 Tax=Cumulibacter soli TaxID=2546344 RepID=UPI00141A405C|nr:ABC transporter substrate-binding protein [Cumulibacter soli]
MTLISALAACGSSEDESGDGSSVTFAVGAPVLIDSTAPYTTVPVTQGYWEDEGMSVEVEPTQGATASMQLLMAGKADISNGGTSSMYQAAIANPDLRIVSLQPKNVWQISVPADSDITEIADLKGKKLGVQSLSSASYLFGRAALAASGVDPDKDVEWIPTGVGSQAAQALNDGTVVAYATYTGPNAVVASVMGEELVDLPTPLDEIPGLSGIATTKDFLADNRDAVVEFLQGYYKGAVFAATNPSAALQIHWAENPEQKPDGDLQEALDATVPTVEERFEGAVETDDSGVIGDVSIEEVQKSIDFMYEYGIIDEQLKAEDIVDLSPSVDANAFDVDAIKQEATDWKP